jgi:hypothetical protein
MTERDEILRAFRESTRGGVTLSSGEAFMEHCRSCWICRSTLADDCGYPGLCQPGLRRWSMMSDDERADAQEVYREDE